MDVVHIQGIEYQQGSGITEMFEHHMSRGQSGMAAKGDFPDRGKPAQFEFVFGRDEECGFRKIVFRCN